MAGGFLEFGGALVAFIGSHAVAGLPGIRGRLLARLGERTYRIVYSVVSLTLLTWVISAAIRAPYVGLWGPFPWTTALLVAVMAPASVLLAASVVEPNPFSLSFARGRFDPARPGTAGLISLHGVGLSVGAPGPLCPDHLSRLRGLVDRYQIDSFFEHLAWSSHGAEYLNDLLPLPYTEETLATVCDHVDEVQQALGRRMLLENPATYVLFAQTTIPEMLSDYAVMREQARACRTMGG